MPRSKRQDKIFLCQNEKKYKYIYDQLANRIKWAERRVTDERNQSKNNTQSEKDRLEKAQAVLSDSLKMRKKFDNWCRQLLVVGFNSNFYDLNLIAGTLLRHFNEKQPFKAPPGLHSRAKKDEDCDQNNDPETFDYDRTDDTDQFLSVLKRKNNRFLTFVTTKLKFVDVMEFLPPRTSLRTFLLCYLKGEQGKAWFPYSLLTSPEDFDRPGFPKYEDFYSSLKKENTLDDGTKDESVGRSNHAKLKTIWDKQDMTTLADLLKYYQMQNCITFYKAVNKMR